MKRLIRILGVLPAALLLWVLVVPLTRSPSGPSVQHNGIWLDRHWLRGSRTREEVQAELERFAALHMTYLFVHAGPLRPDGTIPEFDPVRVGFLRQVTQQVSSDFQLVAWVGGLNAAGGGNVDLRQPAVRQQIARWVRRLVDAGFDGVQLNLEPTPNGDPSFLLVLEAVRAELPPGSLLGAATSLWGPIWLPPPDAVLDRLSGGSVPEGGPGGGDEL